MNTWDERYSQPGHAYGVEPNEFLRSHFSMLPTGRILSLCEGEGRNAVFLAQQGYDVLAVDASRVGIQNAAKLAQQKGVSLQTLVADVATFEIMPNSWDGVVLIFAHLPSLVRAKIHRRVVQGLRPGGIMLLECYGPEQLKFNTGGPKDLDLLPSLEQLKHEFYGLEFLLANETHREVNEGNHHKGHGAVVEIIAKARGSFASVIC